MHSTSVWGAPRAHLAERHGREAVEARAVAMLEDELPALAHQLQQLFREFNYTYFRGALPGYKIRVGYAIDSPQIVDGRWRGPSLGFIDIDARQIWIWVAEAQTMTSTLSHGMAHAATNGDEAWQKEMRRLNALGSPFD